MVDLDRRVFLGAAAAVLGGAAATTEVVSESNTDSENGQAGPWPQYQVDTANTGYAPTQGPRKHLETEWKWDDGLGADSTPALVDGTLYFPHQQDSHGNSGYVNAMDASDGSLNWQVEATERDYVTPAVADGRVFVGGGPLLALDAADGSEHWRAEKDVFRSATVSDGTVYATTGEDERGGGDVTAFDASDGTIEWTFDPATEATEWQARSTPAVAGDTVYVGAATVEEVAGGDERYALYALAAETGEQRWRVKLLKAGDDPYRPVYVAAPTDGDSVYVSAGDIPSLVAVDATSGEQQWSFYGGRRPTVHDGTVYAADTHERVVALDADTGDVQWEFDPAPVNEEVVHVNSNVTVTTDTLYFGSLNNGLYAVDAASGEKLDRKGTPQEFIHSPPAAADGTAYVPLQLPGGLGGGLYAVVEGEFEKPPDPTVYFKLAESDTTHCVGESLDFERMADVPERDWDEGEDEGYAWKLDFDTGDDEESEYETLNLETTRFVTHAYEEPGTYEAALTVKDPYDRTVTETVTVDVVECDGPTARITTNLDGAESLDLEPGTDVFLTGIDSTTDAESIRDYEWDLDDDGTFEEQTQTVDLTMGEDCAGETVTVTLRVTDETGKSDTASITLSTERDGSE